MRVARQRACAAAVAMIASAGAVAQEYPARALRIIVPAVAGGSVDFVIRPVAQKLATSLKQGVVIDNRPGAAGVVGVQWAVRGAPDGYTLLLGTTGSVALPPALNPRLAYDLMRDMIPITLLADAPYVLFVHPSLPAKSVRELVSLAKARPAQIDYGSLGRGSFNHFVTEAFNAATAIKMAHVPYKESAAAAAGLLGGEVMVNFDALQANLSHVRDQRLRALAIGAAKRAPVAPEIPTFAEAGVANFSASAWFGLFAPVNTPQDVITKLNAEAVQALRLPDIREHFVRAGIEPVGSTPERFAQQVRDDIARFGRIAKEVGIRGD